MNTTQNQYLNEQTTSHLMEYQIQKINRQIHDFMKEIEQYHFEVCPKCGKLHTHLVKGGSNSVKNVTVQRLWKTLCLGSWLVNLLFSSVTR